MACPIPGIPIPVSQLVLGTVYFHRDRQAEANAVLDRFLERGGNTFDTAHCYGPNSSETLGRWISDRGVRDQVVIIDKGCHPYGSPRMSVADLEADLADDLQRLGTGRVDLWMFHRDDAGAHLKDLLAVLDQKVKEGVVGAIGASNWTTARIAQANQIAHDYGWTPLVASSPNLCLAIPNEPMWSGCVSMSEEDKQWHAETGMPVFAWSSVARGFFAGFEDDDVRRVFHNEVNFQRRSRTETLAAKLGVKPVQIALAWTLSQPFPVHALVGCRTAAEVDEAFGAIELAISDEDLAWLERG